MDEPADDPNAELPQPSQALVVPGEVELVRGLGSDRFPQDGIANGLHAKIRHRIEIAHPEGVTGVVKLVAIFIADAQVGAFDAAP